MNPLVKSLLKVGEVVATATVPGGALIDASAHAVFDHKENIGDASPDIALGAIQAIEAFKESDIADEAMFRQGVSLLNQGYKLVHDSLKHKDGTPA